MKKTYLLISLMMLSFVDMAGAQTFNFKENAVYIFNFVKNTEFPQKKASYEIGVIGATGVEVELKNLLTSKKVTTMSIKHITPAEAKTVDVVIVAAASSKSLKEITTAIDKLPILVITEKAGLNFTGSCVSLFMDEDDGYKTKYELSPFNLRSRGLVMNQQIVGNAVLVR